jgi:hypothetical protein
VVIYIAIPYFVFTFKTDYMLPYALYAGYLIMIAQNRSSVDLWDMLFIPTLFIPFIESILYLIPLLYLYLQKEDNTKSYVVIVMLYLINTFMQEYRFEFSAFFGILLLVNILFEKKNKLEKRRYLCLFSIIVLLQNDGVIFGFSPMILSALIATLGLLSCSKEKDRILLFTLGFFISLFFQEDILIWATLVLMTFPVIIKVKFKKSELYLEKFLLITTLILGFILIERYIEAVELLFPVMVFVILMLKYNKNIVLSHCRGELIYKLLVSTICIGVSVL